VGADTRLRLCAVPRLGPPGVARALAGHSDEAKTVALLSDGTLCTAGRDGTLRLWAQGGASCQVVTAHSSPVFALAALPGAGVASASGDTCVRLWARAAPEESGGPALKCTAVLCVLVQCSSLALL
jgi:WD40 repeat protein